MRTVDIDVTDSFMSPWGPVGEPPDLDGNLEPTFFIGADVVAECLQPQGCTHRGVTVTVDRAGFLTVATPDGIGKYELFPARFSDDLDDVSDLYLAVWPD